jgi:transposase
MLVGLRDRLISNRTQLSNAIRGYAAEFGLTAAKGMAHLDPLLERIQADESLPVAAREPPRRRNQAKRNRVDWHAQSDALQALLSRRRTP